MSEIVVCGNQFVVKMLIHVVISIVEVNGWRCKNFGKRIALEAAHGVTISRKVHARGGLRSTTGVLIGSVPASLEALDLIGRRDRGRLWGCPQAGQEVTTAGPRGGTDVGLLGFIDGRDLGRRGNAQTLDMRAFAARSKTRARNANSVVERRLVSHLSNTASVDAHFSLEFNQGVDVQAVDRRCLESNERLDQAS